VRESGGKPGERASILRKWAIFTFIASNLQLHQGCLIGAPDCYAGGRGFPCLSRHHFNGLANYPLFKIDAIFRMLGEFETIVPIMGAVKDKPS
jgi:hypothetical protein